jgi:uroporphyrin-III C-methyltransferase
MARPTVRSASRAKAGLVALGGGERVREPGRVTLVGAGPGDPELLTIKALKALQAAQVVVHDGLVSDEILDLAPAAARRINVAKRKSRHTLPQDDINQLLVALALEGLEVVRLKGGDPFLFGRGGVPRRRRRLHRRARRHRRPGRLGRRRRAPDPSRRGPGRDLRHRPRRPR